MISSIRQAITSIATTLPELAQTANCGEDSGKVVACSSRDLSGETLTADEPLEMRRFVGTRSDFPSLDKGSAIEIGASLHIVTSAKTDALGASLTFGVSAPLENIAASYSGIRKDGKIKTTIDVLAIEVASEPNYYGDSIAPNTEHSWLICIAEKAWTALESPQISDSIVFIHPRKDWETVRLRVASAIRHDGYFILKARPKGGA